MKLTSERIAEIRAEIEKRKELGISLPRFKAIEIPDDELRALLDVYEATRNYIETRQGPEWFRNGDLDKYNALRAALGED